MPKLDPSGRLKVAPKKSNSRSAKCLFFSLRAVLAEGSTRDVVKLRGLIQLGRATANNVPLDGLQYCCPFMSLSLAVVP